jgi:hypothetical protein
MSLWFILFLCLTACADSPGGDGPAPDPQGPPRLSLSDILHGAERAGVASRLEVAGHDRACFEQEAFTSIRANIEPEEERTCIGAVFGDVEYVNARLVSALSDIITNRECSRAITPYAFSRPGGASNAFYIPDHKHLVFYGPDYGWMLMPVSDEAAAHVLSGGFCAAGE